MSKNHSQNSNSDLAYIKSVMARSEVGFKELRQFFWTLAGWSFLSGILTSMLRNYIYTDEAQTGNLFRDVLVNTLLECGMKVLLLIPVLVFMLLFYKRVKARNQGMGVWLFKAVGFVLIFCGMALPVAATAVSASYEAADLFSILTCAICMLLCGIFTDSRPLKCTAYIYTAIPMVILSVLGMMHLYNEYTHSTDPSMAFVLAVSYTRSFFYVLYPAIGYAVISLNLKNKSKGKTDREL